MRASTVGNSGFWASRSVFVTGGTGLIGSWTVKRLLGAGARVVVLVKDAPAQSELVRSGDIGHCTLVYGNLEDHSAIANAINVYETETVLHVGAQTLVGAAHRDPLSTLETNVRGTYNVLEACRANRQINMTKRRRQRSWTLHAVSWRGRRS
jgi:CDP-glucose 4,6-dehydratase